MLSEEKLQPLVPQRPLKMASLRPEPGRSDRQQHSQDPNPWCCSRTGQACCTHAILAGLFTKQSPCSTRMHGAGNCHKIPPRLKAHQRDSGRALAPSRGGPLANPKCKPPSLPKTYKQLLPPTLQLRSPAQLITAGLPKPSRGGYWLPWAAPPGRKRVRSVNNRAGGLLKPA